MKICIANAVGQARTELAAFDRALLGVGAGNRNLIRLSSVIPQGSVVTRTDRVRPAGTAGWGDRLYCVYADCRTSEPGREVWAGVGWVQESCAGRGLFVEHDGASERSVREQITVSLEDLQAGREIDFGPIEMAVVGARCTGTPICALVLCAYLAESWPDL
jgi:arginine decarboxylase